MSLAPDPQRRHWGSIHEYQALGSAPENIKLDDPLEDLTKEGVLRWLNGASQQDSLWVVRELTKETKDPRLQKEAVPLVADLALSSGEAKTPRDKFPSEKSDGEQGPISKEESRPSNLGGSEGSNAAEPLINDQARMEKLKSQRLELSPAKKPEPEQPMAGAFSETTHEDSTKPIVQFGSFRHFCMKEKETHMQIDVMRIGDLTQRSIVHFTTKDGSAKAGMSYEATKGFITFEPGVNHQSVEVPIVLEAFWNPTLEFSVNLLQTEMENAVLGRYLWETRVSVMDDGAFPSKKFKQAILEYLANRTGGLSLGKIANIPKLGLLTEYLKLNFANPGIRRGTIKGMICDQLHNLYFFQGLFLNVYTVDHVLNTEADADTLLIPGSRAWTLSIIFIVTLLPFAVLHFLDYYRFTWRVPGMSKKSLQGAIIRKFLNYRADIRKDLSPGTMILALGRDVNQVVDQAYMPMIGLVRSISSILLMVAFQFIAPAVFNKPFRITVLIPMFLYPIFLIGFIVYRSSVTLRSQEDLNDVMDRFITTTDNIVLNYQLIADYDRRTMFVQEFEGRVQADNDAFKSWMELCCNNNYFAPWLAVLSVGLYTIKAGLAVISGDLSLGLFLTDVAVLKEAGTSWGSIYTLLVQVQGSIPRLERITSLLNFPIDLPQRMVLNRYRRKTTQKLCNEIFESNQGKEFKGLPVDLLPIRIVDPVKGQSRGSMHMAMNKAEITMRQGRLIYILGPHGEGKSVLLRMLSGVTLPKPGEEDVEPLVFVPSHLRQLHVSSEPLFFEGSLYKNLTIGVHMANSNVDGSRERVVKILRRLGMPPIIREYVETDVQHIWNIELTQTQRQLLSIARAIIANPEFLCIHKPIQVLDEFTTERVLELLHEFVTCKGIEQDPAKMSLRRPRTCVVTSNRKLDPKFAHTIIHKRHSDGITIAKDDDGGLTQ